MRLAILLITLCLGQVSQGQITFYENNFGSKVTDVQNIDFDSTKNLGFAIPIYLLKKYDKVEVWLFKKHTSDEKWTSLNYNAPISLEPKSRKFRDNYGTSKYVYAYISTNDEVPSKFKDYAIMYDKMDRRRLAFHETKYMVRVAGYFSKGTDSRWNSNTDSFESYTKYEFSKYFLESAEFTYARDEKALAEEQAKKDKLALEKKNNTLSYISASLLDYTNLHLMDYHTSDLWKSIIRNVKKASEDYDDDNVDFLASEIEDYKTRYYKIKKKYDPIPMTEGFIWKKYKIARGKLLKEFAFKRECELQKKIMELMKVKTKLLKAAFGGEEDPEKIISIFMSFKVE